MIKMENFVAKGKIAHHEQLLLLPQCFQKSSAPDASESVCMRKRVDSSPLIDAFCRIYR